MPEIPDLQVFSRNLTKTLAGKTVDKVLVPVIKKLNVPAEDLENALKGQQIQKVERDGKQLHLTFSSGDVLAIHLMLHGGLFLFEGKNTNKWPVLELHFTDGSGLALTDFQKAAKPTLNPDKAEAIDALSDKLDAAHLTELLSKSKSTIKNLLMDQDIIRGIGNAYSDEILWHARISPFSACNKIPAEKIKVLAKSIKTVLHQAEKDISNHQPDIINGEVRDFMKVHHPEKEKSPGGANIQIKKTGSRKTYYTDEQEEF